MNLKSFSLILIRNYSTNVKKNVTSAEYCLQSVRRHDYENFMCTLLLKNRARSCAFAIRGFNVEVARVGEQVSDPNIGLMRLQFWEDAINSCYSKDFAEVPHHPVTAELYKAITRGKLTKGFFTQLIGSRRDYLKVNSFQSLADLEKYSEKSVSSIYYLILEGSGIKNVNADHAASHLGKAQGIVQQIRAAAHAKKLNIISIPRDVLAKHKISYEELIRGTGSDRLKDATYEVASLAHQHLVKARSLAKTVPSEASGVLLPAVAVANYLDKLQQLNYDVLHPKLQQRSWLWLPKLWFSHLRKVY